MKIKSFYDLDTWKEAHQLTLLLYKLTKEFPSQEKYGLTNQIRRAVTSIGANIAEGFGRYHFADKVRFYHQARGSLKEIQNFILLTKDLNYLEEKACQEAWEKSNKIEKLINGLIRSAGKQTIGNK